MIVSTLAEGQFPAEVMEAVEKNSKKENLSVGRLHQFTDEERKLVKGIVLKTTGFKIKIY